MRVRDGMSRVVLMVGPGHTLREAAQLMAERKVGAAVVMDPDAMAPGILTERDVVRALGKAIAFRAARLGTGQHHRGRSVTCRAQHQIVNAAAQHRRPKLGQGLGQGPRPDEQPGLPADRQVHHQRYPAHGKGAGPQPHEGDGDGHRPGLAPQGNGHQEGKGYNADGVAQGGDPLLAKAGNGPRPTHEQAGDDAHHVVGVKQRGLADAQAQNLAAKGLQDHVLQEVEKEAQQHECEKEARLPAPPQDQECRAQGVLAGRQGHGPPVLQPPHGQDHHDDPGRSGDGEQGHQPRKGIGLQEGGAAQSGDQDADHHHRPDDAHHPASLSLAGFVRHQRQVCGGPHVDAEAFHEKEGKGQRQAPEGRILSHPEGYERSGHHGDQGQGRARQDIGQAVIAPVRVRIGAVADGDGNQGGHVVGTAKEEADEGQVQAHLHAQNAVESAEHQHRHTAKPELVQRES